MRPLAWFEHVADASHGVQELRLEVTFDLFSQTRYEHVDHVRARD